MEIIYIILLAIAAFLLGSFPFSPWVGRIFLKRDIRNYGQACAVEETIIRQQIWINVNPVVSRRNNKMDENTNKTNNAVKFCAECPVCRYTRKSKKEISFILFADYWKRFAQTVVR